MQLRVIPLVAIVVLLVLAWATVVVGASLYRWGKAPLAPRGDTAAFARAARGYLEEHARGNAALLLLDNGSIAHQHYLGSEEDVGPDTLFQLASISKWVAAWGVLGLVEQGLVDLDAPVEQYLTRWQLPDSRYDHRGVTVRRLLSHSAGLTDRLGYQGFPDGQGLQTLEESLSGAADAADHADAGPVRVGRRPGSRWQYSGGSYALLELLVEEVTGQNFNAYMRQAVFLPLGMETASFSLEEAAATGVLAAHHGSDGALVAHRQFAATAPSSLHASAAELARFAAAHLPGPNGEPPGRGVLSPRLIDEMLAPQVTMFGIGLWGLGPILYDLRDSGHGVFGHDGHNSPGISTTLRIDRTDGSGIMVLGSGNPHLAMELGSEWYYWKTGSLDQAALGERLPRMAWIVLAGATAINLVAALLRYRKRR
ncbi:serine hydrolase domain-containing protein [Spirochaeta africana]|uniref:Penicillin-binding protein, beta-lactamase class C n=1 Tax=Spirochaeta africana (strain ATCC 700263 / DSM 8902 / Z-7692) TaxID=889378 RepID=H9UHX5_SPIAZ|nr:serine hydrolase domain-containing protein [Spirochaeta africana]AFG37118.1 penicillin-binding protein, beta-lactamase class C [Spirochaeta africana DSM 8902]